MEMKPPPSIVYVHIKLPISVNDQELLESRELPGLFKEMNVYSSELESLFFNDESKGDFIKVAEGAFLVDEDAWYPNMLALMKWCEQKKCPYAMLPVGDSAATFSRDNDSIARWLYSKQKRARLTAK